MPNFPDFDRYLAAMIARQTPARAQPIQQTQPRRSDWGSPEGRYPVHGGRVPRDPAYVPPSNRPRPSDYGQVAPDGSTQIPRGMTGRAPPTPQRPPVYAPGPGGAIRK